MAAQESSASVSAGSRYVAGQQTGHQYLEDLAGGRGKVEPHHRPRRIGVVRVRPPRRARDAATTARRWAEAQRLTGASLASGLAREAFTQLA